MLEASVAAEASITKKTEVQKRSDPRQRILPIPYKSLSASMHTVWEVHYHLKYLTKY